MSVPLISDASVYLAGGHRFNDQHSVIPNAVRNLTDHAGSTLITFFLNTPDQSSGIQYPAPSIQHPASSPRQPTRGVKVQPFALCCLEVCFHLM